MNGETRTIEENIKLVLKVFIVVGVVIDDNEGHTFKHTNKLV